MKFLSTPYLFVLTMLLFACDKEDLETQIRAHSIREIEIDGSSDSENPPGLINLRMELGIWHIDPGMLGGSKKQFRLLYKTINSSGKELKLIDPVIIIAEYPAEMENEASGSIVSLPLKESVPDGESETMEFIISEQGNEIITFNLKNRLELPFDLRFYSPDVGSRFTVEIILEEL